MNAIRIGLVGCFVLSGLVLAQGETPAPKTVTVWEASIKGVSG